MDDRLHDHGLIQAQCVLIDWCWVVHRRSPFPRRGPAAELIMVRSAQRESPRLEPRPAGLVRRPARLRRHAVRATS